MKEAEVANGRSSGEQSCTLIARTVWPPTREAIARHRGNNSKLVMHGCLLVKLSMRHPQVAFTPNVADVAATLTGITHFCLDQADLQLAAVLIVMYDTEPGLVLVLTQLLPFSLSTTMQGPHAMQAKTFVNSTYVADEHLRCIRDIIVGLYGMVEVVLRHVPSIALTAPAMQPATCFSK